MIKVKRFLGHYPEFKDVEEIEKVVNTEGAEILSVYQSVVCSSGDDMMVITTIHYEVLEG